jgi:hypothetical protein
VPPFQVLHWLPDQGRSIADEFEYFGSKRFIAAANDRATARITGKEVYEPVESNARPSITGKLCERF